MMALSRSAAGIWCGASQAGHGDDEAGAPGPRWSSAPAALAATARGEASPAGSSATASGSETGTSCSERMRGQRAAIGGIELEDVGNEIISGLAGGATARQLRPEGRGMRWDRQPSHHARIEAAESAACRVGDEPRECGQPARVEERAERGGVRGIAGCDPVDRVEWHQLRCGYDRVETAAQVRPDHAVLGNAERRAKQLPWWSGAIVRTAPQPLFVAFEPCRDVARQVGERRSIGAMCPEHEAAGVALPP